MKKILFFVVFSLILGAGAWADQKSLSVMKFTTTAGSGTNFWYGASWDIGDGMAEMLVTALVETGKFKVLERQQIHDVLGEQDLGDSGRVDPATAAKIGKILGARYLIYGTVNEFEYSKAGGGGGVRIGGLRVGASEAKARVGMDVRIVDAVSSEILFSTRSIADANRTGFKVGYSGADLAPTWGLSRRPRLARPPGRPSGTLWRRWLANSGRKPPPNRPQPGREPSSSLTMGLS
ncbi:MAG: CsgG/HfaB family protein [Candidatus Aminicenantales bacterium]